MGNWPNLLIEQCADPFILRHLDHYYFIVSVSEYDQLEIRCAATLEGLRDAEPVVVWRAPQSRPMSQLVWVPELREIDDKWYIYFTAIHTRGLDALGMFQHRMLVLRCADSNPLTGRWQGRSQVVTPSDTFILDAATFIHQSKRWYLWAQESLHIEGNSNLYLAEMANLWTLEGKLIMLSKPEFDQECRGFKVSESPAVLVHGDKLFISCSASVIDENHRVGLLWIDRQADPLQPASWHKTSRSVFRTSYEGCQYGPGRNSFTQAPTEEDMLVYCARNYTEMEGDSPYDPNRHTRLELAS